MRTELSQTPDPPPAGAAPADRDRPFARTPNAERFLLESDALRRRQLQTSALHGSGRVWRDRARVWPAVVAGFVLIAVIIGGIAVRGAYHRQKEIQQERDRRLNPSPTLTVSPSGRGTPPPSVGPSSRR